MCMGPQSALIPSGSTLRSCTHSCIAAPRCWFRWKLSTTPIELTWSPDGGRFALYYKGEIWTAEVASGALRQWTHLAPLPHYPAWSPDGRYIMYNVIALTNGSPDTVAGLHLIDTRDGSTRAVLHDGLATFAVERAQFSPDGRQIALSRGVASGIYELFVMNTDGTGYHRLTDLGGQVLNPQWTRDGRRLFFDLTPRYCGPTNSANRTMWIVNADGTNPHAGPITLGDTNVQFGFPFSLAPDGIHIAYIGLDRLGLNGVVRTMTIYGTERRQITPNWRVGEPWP